MGHSGGVGRRSDPRPPVEILGADEETGRPKEVRVGRGRGSRRTPLGLAALVIVLLVGGLVLGDDDETADPDPADEPADGDIDPSPSSTVGSGPTTTVVGEAAGPVFGEPAGASVLMGSERGGWRYLDLDTGVLRDVPELEGTAPQSVLPVRGGVVVLEAPTGIGPELVSLPDGERSRLPAPLRTDQLSVAIGVLSSGEADRVWVLLAPTGPADEQRTPLAGLVSVAGEPIVEAFDVTGGPTMATTDGLIFDSGGRTYLSGPAGVRLLADGTAQAASSSEVAVLSCDEAAACAAVIVDVASGGIRPGPPLPGANDGSLWMSLAPDGRLATAPSRLDSSSDRGVGTGRPPVTVSLTDPGGTTTSVEVPDVRAEPAWLPGDLGLVAVTGYGLVRIFEDGGVLTTERVRGVRAAFDTSILVIPHAP